MRLALAAFAGMALAMLTASPAVAADVTGSTVSKAEATWYFTRAGVAYGVNIQAIIENDRIPQAGVQRTVGVNVQMTVDYVDPKTGEPVSAFLMSDPYFAPASSLSVDFRRGASVRAAVTVETPLEPAAGGGGSGPHLGPYTIQVAADWTPASGTTHTYSDVWDTEFGVKTMDRTVSDVVDADATASITGDAILGDSPLGDLGPAQGLMGSAKLFQLTQSMVSSLAVASMLDLSTSLGRSTTWVAGAFADWAIGDDRNTQALLTVEEDLSGSGHRSTPIALAEVIQSWCDTATNQEVDVDAFSTATPVTAGYVDSSILGASATADVVVEGLAKLTPDCAEPRWDDSVYEPFGPLQVNLSATWGSTSGVSFYRSLFRESGPGGSSTGRELNRGRQAAATGTLSGDLGSAALTDVINAFLYDDRTRISSS